MLKYFLKFVYVVTFFNVTTCAEAVVYHVDDTEYAGTNITSKCKTLIADYAKAAKTAIENNLECKSMKETSPNTNCMQMAFYFVKGNDCKQITDDNIYTSGWDSKVSKKNQNAKSFYMSSVYSSNKEFGKFLKSKEEAEAYIDHLKLVYDGSPALASYVNLAQEAKAGGLAMHVNHSETIALANWEKKKKESKAQNLKDALDNNPNSIIVQMVSSNAPCTKCRPNLEQLMTKGKLFEAIFGTGQNSKKFSIVYNYLVATEKNDSVVSINSFHHDFVNASTAGNTLNLNLDEGSKLLGVHPDIGSGVLPYQKKSSKK